MRILIFSETEQAKRKQAEARAAGHHASLRNPQYFNPVQPDRSADLVIADDGTILELYRSIGIAAEPLSAPAAPAEAREDDAPPVALKRRR